MSVHLSLSSEPRPYLWERYEMRHGKLCFKGTLIPVQRVFAIQAMGAVSEGEAAAFIKKVTPGMIRMAFEDHNYLRTVDYLPPNTEEGKQG